MVPRRALLRALGLSAAVGTAGCNTDTPDTSTQNPTEPSTATPTRTLTPTPETDSPTGTAETATRTPTVATGTDSVALVPDGVTEFGRAVALSDETAIVVAEGSGAYAFTADNDWAEPAVLTPPEGHDGFGGHNVSVALDGHTAVIGGPGAGPDPDTGAVYLFDRTEDGWTLRHQFSPTVEESTPTDEEPTNEFGHSVAFDGETVAVGDVHDPLTMVPWVGGAFVFSGRGSEWEQDAALGTEASDLFGTAVAVDGDTLLVGTPYAEVAGRMTGTVYVYERRDGTWERRGRFAPDDPGQFSQFGQSVALDGDTAVVGDPGGGRAYVFARTGSEWAQQARFDAPVGGSETDFGQSVTVGGGTAVVGAPQAGETGRAYVFSADSDWSRSKRLAVPGLPEGTEFGFDVALFDETALVGAPFFDGPSGAYLFDL